MGKIGTVAPHKKEKERENSISQFKEISCLVSCLPYPVPAHHNHLVKDNRG